MSGAYHFGRAWESPDPFVATCGCGQAPCGLVDSAQINPDCEEHPFDRAQTIRTSHEASECWWHRDADSS